MTDLYSPRFNLHYLLLGICILLTSCGAQSAIPDEDTSITRRQLSQNMIEKGEMLYIFGTKHSDLSADLRPFGENLQEAFQARRGRGLRLSLYADSLVNEEMLKNNPLMIVGSPEGNQHLRDALKNLPISYQEREKRYHFGGEVYTDAKHMFLLSLYPNPWNEAYPIYIITSQNAAQIPKVFNERYQGQWRGFLRDRWGYEVFKGNERFIMGHFSDKEATRWMIDKASHWDFSDGGKSMNQDSLVNFVAFEGAENPAAAARLSDELEIAKNKLEQWSQRKWKATKTIAYYLYPSTETKGLRTGITHQAHINSKKLEVHAVIQDEFEGKNTEIPYELLVQELLGTSKISALQTGLATYLTPNWQERGYEYWVSRLYEAQSIPDLDMLMDNQSFDRMSRLVRACVSGAWVGFLLRHWGEDAFFTQYQLWETSKMELDELHSDWQNYLKALVKNHPKISRQKEGKVFFKGFNFAHEGYRIYDGYLSEKANQSLKEMNTLGANAAAIVPYTYMRFPNRPIPLPIPENAGSENDESVIRAAYNTQRNGMKVMLKPQIWIGGGSWPGDVAMNNAEDWERFYEYHEAWMSHYALMAEIYEFDLLCIGVEFVKASQNNPQRWINMIQRFRHIYQGPMTYAANWGEEFEKLSIWSALDYIGIDCYYPLSKNEEPTDKELKKGFERILKKIELVSKKYDKPVLFTEIGYRSVKAAWLQPHEGEGSKAMSMECQERCYKAVTQSLEGQDWVAGVFWWKWPSYLEYRGARDRGFAPNDKPAAEILRKWFKDEL